MSAGGRRIQHRQARDDPADGSPAGGGPGGRGSVPGAAPGTVQAEAEGLVPPGPDAAEGVATMKPLDVRQLHPNERKIMGDGFAAGRRGDAPTECPYTIREVQGRIVGRKGRLWISGHVLGTAQLERVRQSYENALETIDAGPPDSPWRENDDAAVRG